MADQKVSDLPSLSGAVVDPADLLYIVDSSAGTAGSKKITIGQFQLAPYSGGTINGVTYFDGSKVLASGSTLTFDGTNLGVGGAAAERLTVSAGSNDRVGASVAGNVSELRLGSSNAAESMVVLRYNRATGAYQFSEGINGNTGNPDITVDSTGAVYFNNTYVYQTARVQDITLNHGSNGDVDSIAFGLLSLAFTTSGAANIAVGKSALNQVTSGSENTGVGFGVLNACSTGDYNVALGNNAGDTIDTGSNNTILGRNADASAGSAQSQVVVGQGLTGKGDNTAFIGGTSGAYNAKNVTTWETTSDARIKKNVADYAGGLGKLLQVRVRTFEYCAPEEITELPAHAAVNKLGTQLGVVAQEFRQVFPECVTENSTGVLSVSTDPLVWHLVNAVKELAARVSALESA